MIAAIAATGAARAAAAQEVAQAEAARRPECARAPAGGITPARVSIKGIESFESGRTKVTLQTDAGDLTVELEADSISITARSHCIELKTYGHTVVHHSPRGRQGPTWPAAPISVVIHREGPPDWMTHADN